MAYLPGDYIPKKRPAQAEYERYLRTPHWRTVRAAALTYAENRCQLCYAPDELEVHHRTYDRLGHERPADVIVLCRACHQKHHDRHDRPRRRRGPFFPPA